MYKTIYAEIFSNRTSRAIKFLSKYPIFILIISASRSGDDQDKDGIFGQKLDSSGSPVGENFRVNSFVHDRQYEPALASLEDGGFVVTWTSDGQESGNSYQDTGIFARKNTCILIRISTFLTV